MNLLSNITECKEMIDKNIKNGRHNIFAFYYQNPDTKEQILIRGYPIEIINNTEIVIVSKCENSDDFWVEKKYELKYCETFTDYNEYAMDKYSSCEGCRYGYGNQLGHTGYGGCVPDDDDMYY